MKPLGVYIHIPFCVHKCNYCDFLSFSATKDARKAYLEALKGEIMQESLQYTEYSVDSVFFGGGTPSILEGEEIMEIMQLLQKYYNVSDDTEVTLELNPGTADKEKLAQLQQAGINRLSIGLQAADNRLLKLLGRIHTYEDFLEIYHTARELGFDNISVDLISALPGQSCADWEQTLKRVLDLRPEHISAYSLIVEEGTPLAQNLQSYPPLPDEDEDRRMYHLTKQLMAQYGYERYEISNYAKKGRASRHNTVYWTRGNYAGFGLGASSMVDNRRWKNTADIRRYQGLLKEKQSVREEIEQLSRQECMEEYMFLGLRMMRGVSEREFEAQFGQSMDAVYHDVLQKWSDSGYLCRDNGYIRLTEQGIDVSNVIMADFLLD